MIADERGGERKDGEEAKKWLEKAADMGHEGAIELLRDIRARQTVDFMRKMQGD